MSLSKGDFEGDGPYVFTTGDVGFVQHALRSALGAEYINSSHVGSSYTVGRGMDLDIVVHVKDTDEACCALDDAGYECNSKDYEDSTDTFKCLRNGLVNVMLVSDAEWYDKFVLAAEVCKTLQLQEKWERIAVHRVIMDGEDAHTAKSTAQGLCGLIPVARRVG